MVNGIGQQDRNGGIVMFDVPEETWKDMNVQQQMLFTTQNLVGFMASPAFMMFKGFRMQVKQNGIILPMHVPVALGKQPVGIRQLGG